MAQIVLKVDVDTWQGTRVGVPRLARLLERFDAPATFLFSLGRDHTGRALRRALRRGFLSKVRRTSVLTHYGLPTLLYGTLLPGPDIGRREAATMRAIADAGFETGIHAWDHVRWQDGVAHADSEWTRREMLRAFERYSEVFGAAPKVHGAAGWQMNEEAYRIEIELGITIASDTRGRSPFVPVDAHGRPLGPLQIPTTLPTLDELIGRDGWDATNVEQALLERTRDAEPVEVYTLHAELEGQRYLDAFDRMLSGWRAQGHRFASLGEIAAGIRRNDPVRCRPALGSVEGRSGSLAVQGTAVPDR